MTRPTGSQTQSMAPRSTGDYSLAPRSSGSSARVEMEYEYVHVRVRYSGERHG